jgi:hypothetical protein
MSHPLLLWAFLAMIEVVRHWCIIRRKKKSPNKVLSFIIRSVIAITVFSVFEWRPIIESFPAYIITGWFIHDVFLNILLGNPVWYLNDHGALDKFQRNTVGVLGALILKLIAMIGLIGIYFTNY